MIKRFILGCIIFTFCLVSLAGAESYMAWDPTRNIPNGRVIGLGKAYMALADDTAAIYSNPAGLAGISSWQICSMSGKFLEDYSYLSLSGVYPTNFGTIGFGFAGSSIGGAYETKVRPGSDPADPIYEIDYSVPAVENYNNVMLLSWGSMADRVLGGLKLGERVPFFKQSFFNDLSLGASLKFFSSGLTGDHIAAGRGLASGNELDLGVQYQPPLKWLKAGVTIQNILPAALGGKLTYATGHVEVYPAIIESGVAVKILGSKDSLLKFREQEVIGVLDWDIYPTLSNYPLILHAGLEYKPIPMVAIRVGLDQDAAADTSGKLGTITNFAGGLGLIYGGFRFDYAFHQFAGAPGMDNSFFSLSYGFIPPKQITFTDGLPSSPDKFVTFEVTVTATGMAINPDITEVRVNGFKTRLMPKGNYTASPVNLVVGKNAITAEGYNKVGKVIEKKKLRVLRLGTYPDVASKYWAYEQVGYIGTAGIIQGYPGGIFKPEGNITRAEMAALLMRTQVMTWEAPVVLSTLEVRSTSEAGLKPRTTNPEPLTTAQFKDVPAKHWAAMFIADAAKLGIVKGYPGNKFNPAGNITRAEGLSMVTRFSSVSEEVYRAEFPDLASGHWSSKTVAGAYKLGMLAFLKDKPFEANKKLTRAEAVEILYRSPRVKGVLNNGLLNWGSY